MSLVDVAILFSFAIASGLSFAVSLQLKQDRANRLFILFCAALLGWSLASLISAFEEAPLQAQTVTVWNILASAATITAFCYSVFTTQILRAHDALVRLSVRLSPIALIIALISIWVGGMHNPDYTLHLFGYVAIAISLIYVLVALWSILSSMHELAPYLRVTGLLMVVAFASQFIDDTRALPVSLGIVAVASLIMGWVILRFQFKKPFNELADEIRVANRDLRQVVTDLATERSHNADLSKQLEASRRYSNYKNTFLDKLGHKLRTPLNSIVGYSSLLESGTYGDLSEKQSNRIITINRNGNTLLSLINDMLDLNRIDAGQFELQPRILQMSTLIDTVKTELQASYIAKNLTLKIEIDPALKPIHADEARISQVLTQLLSNAIKYTEQGGITITAQNIIVKSGLADRLSLPIIGWMTDGDWVVTQVTDTGIGIPPESQSQLFDEFYQADENENAEVQSSGLGLAIVKKLIDLHGGVIWVKSTPAQGSTFYLALRAYNA